MLISTLEFISQSSVETLSLYEKLMMYKAIDCHCVYGD